MTRRTDAVAIAAARSAIAQAPRAPKRPGVVTAIDTHTRVQLDGETTSVAVDATTATAPAVGDRVLVEFRPSGAAYVVAIL